MGDSLRHIDLSYLESMAMGDAALRRSLLQKLERRLPPEMEALDSLIRRKRWEDARRQLHLLQSTLHFAGNADMQKVLDQLREHLQQEHQDAVEIHSLLESMQQLQQLILQDVRAALQAQQK